LSDALPLFCNASVDAKGIDDVGDEIVEPAIPRLKGILGILIMVNYRHFSQEVASYFKMKYQDVIESASVSCTYFGLCF